MSVSYDVDFAVWLDEQLDALRRREYCRLDVCNLIDELDGKVRQKRIELSWCVHDLIDYLLRYQFKPGGRRSAWRASMTALRFTIHEILRQTPSFGKLLGQYALDEYPSAVQSAQIRTGMPRHAFPDKLPYTIDQLIDPDFIP